LIPKPKTSLLVQGLGEKKGGRTTIELSKNFRGEHADKEGGAKRSFHRQKPERKEGLWSWGLRGVDTKL